ncbi:SRPBCC family protein [Maricaulis sp. CAU 1757]
MTALTHSFTQPLQQDSERVFKALTDKADLEVWFAENVSIEAETGGRFQFWGKHTYGAPAHPGIVTELTRCTPGEGISFAWPIEGHDSQVELTLAPTGDGCAVEVRHHFDAAPDRPRVKELIDDLWRLHMGALMSHLMGHDVNLPDFADPHPKVQLDIHVDAPWSEVWRALTEPEQLDKWMTKSATVDLEAGTLDFGWSYEVDGEKVVVPPMRLLEIVEPERLVMEWRDWRGDPDVPHQRVAWLLEEDGQGTRVTLVHDGFTRTVDVSDYPFGWIWFLDQLKAVSQGEKAQAHPAC